MSKMTTLKPDDAIKMNVHKVTKTVITSPYIYKPVGPYSQAILADQTLYVSGVLGMDPQEQVVCGGAEAQARQALQNLRHVLVAGGASLDSVVKTTILLARMDDYQAVNKVYAEYSAKTDASPKMPDEATKSVRKVTKTIVTSPNVYKPVGPYSSAILADKFLFVSGMLGMDVQAKFVEGGVDGQTRKALENLKNVLEAGGASLESVVKTTILLANIDDFPAVNKIYGEFFKTDSPARATFQVGKLPLNAAVEIDAIALSGDLVIAEAGPCPCTKT